MSIDFSSVRSIPPKTKGNRGFFPSKKVPSGIIEYESQLERDFYLILEHAPDVKIFQHQPLSITYKDQEGKNKKYTPDVYVEFINGIRLLVEIKDQITMSKNFSKFKERWDKCEEWSKQRGISFIIISEEEIRTPRMANIWFTLGSSKNRDNNNYFQKINRIIPDEGIAYNDFCNKIAEYLGVKITKASQIISYSIYHGLVFVDTFTTDVISSNTIIRKKKYSNQQDVFLPIWEELDLSLDNKIQGKSDLDLSNDIGSDNDNYKQYNLQIPEEYQNEVDTKHKIVREWLDRPSSKRTPQWRLDFLNRVENKFEKSVSVRTIYRWVNKFEEEGIEGLIPNYSERGRNARYKRDSLELFEEARKHYLSKPTVTLKSAYKYLLKKWDITDLDPPTQSTFNKFVYENTTSSELAYNKRGRRYHKSHFSPALKSFQGAIMPMQVLQFDNTSVDLFPVDTIERQPLSTPNITAAIDCYTRMITGFYMSMSPSSSQTVLETLVQSILPKSKYVDIYETELDWEIDGFPVLILVDNGMDYRAEVVKKFCLDYDIILEFAPIRTPRYKAYIEQWFNVFRQAIREDQIGGYRPLLKKRLENPDLDPQSEAILTTQELNKWMHQWIVDDYHLRNPYNDHVPAPLLRLEDAKQGNTSIILPKPRDAPQDQWEIDLMYLSTLNQEVRQLRNDGIVWHHLKYNSKELAEVYQQIGKGNKVTVYIDRRDIRLAWVENPIDNKPIPVELASGWASALLEIHGDQPISASAWDLQVKLLREEHRNRISPYLYKQALSREKRSELIDLAKKKTKKARKEKERIIENDRKKIVEKVKSDSLKANSSKQSKSDSKLRDRESVREKKDIDLPPVDPYPSQKKRKR